MPEQKITIEEFGKTIKTKYPQYAGIDDKEVAMRVLDKYPEYQTRILPEQAGFFQSVKQDLEKRGENVNEAFNKDQSFASKTLQLIGQGAGFVTDIIGEGVKKVADVTGISKALKPVGTTILNSKLGQMGLEAIGKGVDKYEEFKQANPETAANLEAVVNVAALLPVGKGGQLAVKGATGAAEKGVAIAKGGAEKAFTKVKKVGTMLDDNIAKDIIPTRERIVNSEITRALDLTQGDVKNISKSTGNEVGQFLAEKNLIGNNVQETSTKLDDFYKSNYNLVRDEISKVNTTYKSNATPAYKESLKEIKKAVSDVAGLQDVNKEIDLLLKKKTITLNDVQRAKELMDEHFSLYKATGDVKESVAKEGLAKLRTKLKTFVEDEVTNNTGADIRLLNNNVSTARSIADAIQTRSTRGLTRSMISTGDIVTFLSASAVGTPISGVVAVLAKKLYDSPSFKLKFSKWLDRLSDAKKAKIQEQLMKGELPKEIKINQRRSNKPSIAPNIELKKEKTIKNK